MAGFSVPAAPVGWRPAAAPSTPSRVLQLPSRASATSTATAPAETAAPLVPKKKRKIRNIACVSCNKHKKKCGEIRPCGRCVELGILCQQPIKPEGCNYLTKKRRFSATPPVPPSPPPLPSPWDGRHQFPGTLWTTIGNPRQNDYHLPSPSPSVSTVGTPQPSYTSISSYDDPATTIPASAEKSGDAPLGRLGSYTRPQSVSLDPIEEASSVLMAWDMSRWDLPAPAEELPDEVVNDSRFACAPIFGLEKPTYRPKPQTEPATFGEPMDLENADECGLDNWETQEIGETLGVNAGVATSGVASGSGDGIVWGTDWLDEADLLNTDLNLDDVDLSGFDFSCFDDDTLMDLGTSLQLAQFVPPPKSPPVSPLPPPAPSSLPSRAEKTPDIRSQSPNRRCVGYGNKDRSVGNDSTVEVG